MRCDPVAMLATLTPLWAGPPDADFVEFAFAPLQLLMALLSFVVACFGAFSAASLLVYSPSKLQMRLKNGRGEALVRELESRDPEYQVVARLCALGGLLGAFFAVQTGISADGAPWAYAVLGGVALLFCGVLPAAVAETRAEATLLLSLPLLRAVLLLVRWPLVLPMRALTRGALRILRIREEPTTDRGEIAEEVLAAVNDSVEDDDLADEEKRWIGNIIELKDRHVSEIMTPRTDIVAMAQDLPLQDAVALALAHGFSRYPVYAETVDDVVGVFYVKDALQLAQPGTAGAPVDRAAAVRTMMREPFFVPETMGVPELLRRFKTDRLHMAIVLDEYGGTAGLISIEDILEEIVGDIDDEYDAADDASAEEQVVVIEPGRVVEIPARLPVDEINHLLGTELKEDGDYDTIAGFVISHQNRIPMIGETLSADGVEFKVLAADDRRISRLRLTVLHPASADHDG